MRSNRTSFYFVPGLAPALLLVVWGAPSAQAQVRVVVDQTPVVFAGQPPLEQGGRVLVPLRGVLERLGAFVRYDSQTKVVTALRNATNITLPVGSRRALVGDRAVALDVPAFIANSSVLVPLRFVSEALGARVTWDVGTRTVAIDTRAPAVSPAPSPDPANAIVTGTVTAVYPDLAPRRLVVRVTGTNGAPAQEKTIPLEPDATVSLRRSNTPLAITLDRVRVGDIVEVRQTREGIATSIVVAVRAPEPPAPSPKPKPASPGPAASTTFKGEFLEASRVGTDRWMLKMTDNRSIEVPGSIPIAYGSEKITIDDLRSGDQVTITLDPKTKRPTRMVVAVER